MPINRSTIRRGIQLYKMISFEFPMTQEEKDALQRSSDSKSLTAILDRYEEAASNEVVPLWSACHYIKFDRNASPRFTWATKNAAGFAACRVVIKVWFYA